jgi:hypothetical protein
MNLMAGLYIGAWMLIWLATWKVIELQWRGSAVSQALGVITG